jgi:hypothetical protein
MAHFTQSGRLARVHGPGALLVCSDIHGNLADLERMVALMEAEPDAALLLLGDLFHGPNVSEAQWNRLYAHLADYYPDESDEVFRAMVALQASYPDRVLSLLGNHDHAHVGGPTVSKFYDDEAAAMEDMLALDEIPTLHAWLERFPVIAVADCGVAFTHASPPARPFTRADLDAITLRGYEHTPLHAMIHKDLLGELLWRRGCDEPDTRAFLERLYDAQTGPRCHVVVHGHEIAREGWEMEHLRVCNLSTSFGMHAPNKHYLRLDLTRTYEDALQLRPGRELLRLYPDAPYRDL